MFFQKMYKPIPLLYNLVLAMLWRHPENVELDKVKVVHYCAAVSILITHVLSWYLASNHFDSDDQTLSKFTFRLDRLYNTDLETIVIGFFVKFPPKQDLQSWIFTSS